MELSPEIGIHFANQNLRVGGYFVLNMGESYPHQYGLTLSYDFKYQDLKGFFGILSEKYQIGEYPLLYFREDYKFYHPNINGVLLQYDSKQTRAEILFNWYGGNIIKRIDEFLIQGFYQSDFWDKKFYLGGSFLVYHIKNDSLVSLGKNNVSVYLLDQIFYHLYLGSDLTSLTPMMDHLNFKLGWLSSLERKRYLDRRMMPFLAPLGGELDIQIQYKGFGIENNFYVGEPQYQYWEEYGELAYNGVPFYHSKIYNRTELYYEFKNPYVKARASFVLHTTPKALANQQIISIVLDTQKLFSFLGFPS